MQISAGVHIAYMIIGFYCIRDFKPNVSDELFTHNQGNESVGNQCCKWGVHIFINIR